MLFLIYKGTTYNLRNNAYFTQRNIKSSIRKTPTRKIFTNQTPPRWIPLRKILTQKFPPGIFPPGFFNFFVFSLLSPLSLILLKRLFGSSIFYKCRSQRFRSRCIKIICRLPVKMVTYLKKFCWPSMIIGHYYNPPVCFECFYLWSFSWGMWCYSIQ